MADMVDVEMMEYMRHMPDDRRPGFQMAWRAQKKDKTTAMLLSLLWLFGIAGIGRMYAGDIGLGVALLLVGPFTCYIWPLVDTFLVGGAVENHNRNILAQLKMTYPV